MPYANSLPYSHTPILEMLSHLKILTYVREQVKLALSYTRLLNASLELEHMMPQSWMSLIFSKFSTCNQFHVKLGIEVFLNVICLSMLWAKKFLSSSLESCLLYINKPEEMKSNKMSIVFASQIQHKNNHLIMEYKT